MATKARSITRAYLVYDYRIPGTEGKPQLSQAKYKVGDMSLYVGGISCPEMTPEVVVGFVRRNFGWVIEAQDVVIVDTYEKMLEAGWQREGYAYCFCGNRRGELPFRPTQTIQLAA